MPIDCVWFEKAPDGPWEPGWCFPAWYEYNLSKHYEQHVRSVRPPIMVMLPVRPLGKFGTPFIVDSHPTNDPNGSWTVTINGPLVEGEKPDITLDPSIDAKGSYHGWLKNGVLSDDLGG